MNEILLFFLVLGAPFAELLRFSFFGVSLRVMDIITLFLFLRLWQTEKLRKNIFLNGFCFTLVLSNFANLNVLNSAGVLYLFRTFIYLYVFVSLKRIRLSVPFRKKLKLLFESSLILTALLGLTQYFFYPNLRNLIYLGFDPHYYRLFGTFLDPNLSGLVFVFALVYFLQKPKTILSILLCFLFALCLLLTYSRTSYLTLIAVFTYWGFQKKIQVNRLLLASFSIFFILGIIILPRYFGEGTNLLRLNSLHGKWQSAVNSQKLFWQKPLLGYGYNNVPKIKASLSLMPNDFPDNARFSMENSYLTVLVTSGLLGLTAFLLFLVAYFRRLNIKAAPFFLATLIHSLSTNSFFTPGIIIFLGLFIFFSLPTPQSKA
jgi:O-antigen ligase